MHLCAQMKSEANCRTMNIRRPLTVILLVTASVVYGQVPRGNSDNKQGDRHVNFGVGASGWGIPLYGQYEQMLYRELSLGGEISLRFSNETIHAVEYKHNMVALGAISNYYFDHLIELPAFWDLYGGASLGFIFVNTSASVGSSSAYSGKRDSGLYLGLHFGSRYYFSNQWAINAELEFATTLGGLKLGATYRF